MPTTTRPASQVSITKTKKGARWIDVPRPAQKDLDWLQKKFHIHPVILEELRGPSARSRVEAYDNYLYLIYYFPVYDPKEETSRRTEIDFLITKDTVVTVHYEHLDALLEIKDKAQETSFRLAYEIIETLLQAPDASSELSGRLDSSR